MIYEFRRAVQKEIKPAFFVMMSHVFMMHLSFNSSPLDKMAAMWQT